MLVIPAFVLSFCVQVHHSETFFLPEHASSFVNCTWGVCRLQVHCFSTIGCIRQFHKLQSEIAVLQPWNSSATWLFTRMWCLPWLWDKLQGTYFV